MGYGGHRAIKVIEGIGTIVGYMGYKELRAVIVIWLLGHHFSQCEGFCLDLRADSRAVPVAHFTGPNLLF